MKAVFTLSCIALVVALGCSKKPREQTAGQPSAPAQGAPSIMPSSAMAADDDSDIDLPEDFADEAAEEVTAENLDTQLDALEKEISSPQ